MAQTQTQTTITLAARPRGDIVPGETFRINRDVPVPTEKDLKEGEILVKVLWISVDPAMRGWLNDVRSYVPPVGIGEVMRAGGIGKVLASKSDAFSRGDFVNGMVGWREYAIMQTSVGSGTQKIIVPDGALLSDFQGLLGMVGFTAYFGLFDVCQPKAGETIVVSGAAGGVGIVVCQLAKIVGCRVVGVAGGRSKCDFLVNELGVDVALDYKAPTFREDFKKATPNYIDCVFENVGGAILDLFLTRLKPGARIALCGSVSEYNNSKPAGLQNYLTLISMRATLRGFIVFDYIKQYGEASKKLAGWIKEGKLKRREHVLDGIESCVDGLKGLFEGKNTGKTLIRLEGAESHL